MTGRTKNRIRRMLCPSAAIIFVLLIVYTIAMLVPLLWGLLNSVRTRGEFVEEVFGFPREWAFENYRLALREFYVTVTGEEVQYDVFMDDMLWYSFIYAAGGAFASTAVHCLTAYVVQKFSHYKLSPVIEWTVLITMILPVVGSLPSAIVMMHYLRLYDTLPGVYLMNATFLGMNFLIFTAAFSTIPKSFSEAAYVDGAGNFSVMFRIALPMVKTTFMIIFLLTFIGLWNDYQGPMIYLPSYPTAAYGLYWYSQKGSDVNSVPMRLAGCMLLFLPIFVIYLLTHNRMIGNLTLGGIKG